MIKQCKKCGSENLYLEPRVKGQDVLNADMVALKCKDCGAWLKWCPKDERQFYINKKQENKIKEFWVIQRDDGKWFNDIEIVHHEETNETLFMPIYAEKIEDVLADKANIFKDKESANDYIRRFCKTCKPVKVEIRVVGE